MKTFRNSVAALATLLALAAVWTTARPLPLPEAAAKRSPAPRSRYTLFESGQVRPLALSPNGRLLFACNTPDNRLEVFRVSGRGLAPRGSVAVGLEPVAVAARTDREVWVVNHLSDSVSIVRLRDDVGDGDEDGDGPGPGRRAAPGWVERTLLVGDEPRDIVFAGKGGGRAFITTAHRGQNAGFDPELMTPGVGRADVWVFDAQHPGEGLGGAPLTRITLFSDTPRALAASPDGSKVYAAGFLSGNRTTTITEGIVSANGGTPPPHTNYAGIPQAPTGLIVKFDGTHWVDELGRQWDSKVRFSLPDKDVFVLDADANPPAPLPGPGGFFSGVGTVLFNMVVNPVNGHVYVSNTDAQNQVRFEGPGTLAGHTVRGHLALSRVTVLGPGVTPRHLNKHINFADCCNPNPNEENQKSLAFPTGMEISADGSTLYLAALGSSKIGVFSTAALEADTFVPDTANQIVLSGGGPTGLALDEPRGRLYVLTRFNNSVAIVDTAAKREVGSVALYNPEPAHIVRGRRFLYDASFSSAHGDSACASCHIFGDFDALAWDLGVPENDAVTNVGIFTVPPEPFGVSRDLQPLKGPMTTQSLRGLANHGAMHWRGDRQNNSQPSVQPDGGAFDEFTAFMKFNVAFPSLTGRSDEISNADMEAFTRFVLEISYPPNPIRNLDDTLGPSAEAGRALFFDQTRKTDAVLECNGCHVLDRNGNAQFGVAKPGFFGTDGRFSFEFEPQVFKIPHLRNLYQKVGMFGMSKAPLFLPENPDPSVDNPFTGDQVRGFGFLHDGSVDTLLRFHGSVVFMQRPPGTLGPLDTGNPTGIPPTPAGFQERVNLSQFLFAFDSNLKPIVGQQVTFTGHNEAAALPRLELMIARADAGDCELVAKRGARGYLYVGGGMFRPDRSHDPFVPGAVLRALAREPRGEVTFTCVPPGSGARIGIDRNDDGVLDGDE
jgi:DNA-binding beta-propeller fold protein YncE